MVLFFSVLLGLVLGSFFHAWIDRSHKGESIASGRSKCPGCGHVLAWYDLIPVFSWVMLRARCRYCHQKIPWHYVAMELLGALIAIVLYYWLKF